VRGRTTVEEHECIGAEDDLNSAVAARSARDLRAFPVSIDFTIDCTSSQGSTSAI